MSWLKKGKEKRKRNTKRTWESGGVVPSVTYSEFYQTFASVTYNEYINSCQMDCQFNHAGIVNTGTRVRQNYSASQMLSPSPPTIKNKNKQKLGFCGIVQSAKCNKKQNKKTRVWWNCSASQVAENSGLVELFAASYT